MATLKLKRENAIEAFREGTEAERKLLQRLYPNEQFIVDIKDRVKTFEDAFNVVKEKKDLPEWLKDIVNVDHFSKVSKWLRVFVICAALRENWVPDWNNQKERKYFVYREFVPGSGWRFADSFCNCTFSSAGSRLALPDAETCEYAGKQFPEEYNDYFTI